MTFWQHRGGTPFPGPKTVDLGAPLLPYAREKVKSWAPSEEGSDFDVGSETLKKAKKRWKKRNKWKSMGKMRKKLEKMGKVEEG